MLAERLETSVMPSTANRKELVGRCWRICAARLGKGIQASERKVGIYEATGEQTAIQFTRPEKIGYV